MESYDFDVYNALIHKGNLPVRVLPHNFLEQFENITSDFLEDLQAEVTYNGMHPGITYNIQERQIREIAFINNNREIELFENFNQYLWCICYSLLVIFDEGIFKPLSEGTFKGRLDLTNPYVSKGIKIFDTGLDLLTTYSIQPFYQLPNPEKYNKEDQYYIELTNGVFTSAIAFILLHEFAHQYYGHLDYYPSSSDSKKNEYAADDFAIAKIAENFQNENAVTLKFGIIAGIASLLLLDKSVDGGEEHPDVDDRLKAAIEQLELTEDDNLWGIASLTFILWMIRYKIELEQPSVVETFKDFFYLSLKSIKEM